MRRRDGSAGIVVLAALDIRRRPDHRAELGTQLLLGETVRVLAAALGGQWLRVRNDEDGYEGWGRAWGIRRVSRAVANRWRSRARGRVVRSFADVWSLPSGGHQLTPLFWNARLIVGRRRGARRAVTLPDGRRGWAPTSAVGVGLRPPPLLRRIRGLLGTPYLWGGRTPHGFDCSGFVQQLLWEQGIPLPRDADDQLRAARRPPGAAILRKGDLVFFGPPRGPAGHVGVALGRGYYAHCRGSVMVSSVDPRNKLYDKDLSAKIMGFGRPEKLPFRGARSLAKRPKSA